MRFEWHFGARAVLVAGPLTLKFPRLIIWDDYGFRSIVHSILTFNRLGIYLDLLRFWLTVKENWREASWTFSRHRPDFLVPCVLPLIIVNVYPTVSGVGKLKIRDAWEIFGERYAAEHHPQPYDEFHRLIFFEGDWGHTFYDNNFAVTESGAIKMLDYGGEIQKVLVKYPEKVRELLLTASTSA